MRRSVRSNLLADASIRAEPLTDFAQVVDFLGAIVVESETPTLRSSSLSVTGRRRHDIPLKLKLLLYVL